MNGLVERAKIGNLAVTKMYFQHGPAGSVDWYALTRDYIKEVILSKNTDDELQILLKRAYKRHYKIRSVK